MKKMSDKDEKKRFVTPGEKLGVVEEFFNGPGTYERAGSIYSETTGNVTKDFLNRKVSVSPLIKEPILPCGGSIVTGIVSSVQGKAVTLNIFEVDGFALGAPLTGFLHVSRSSPKYERNITDVCKLADIMKAKVVDNKNGFTKINTVDRNLGVIRASCSKCGNLMIFRKNGLECNKCGNIERRKVSEDYVVKDLEEK
jgi:exosome complex component CSL4